MKVGMVSPYDYERPGGVGEHVRHLATELRRKRCRGQDPGSFRRRAPARERVALSARAADPDPGQRVGGQDLVVLSSVAQDPRGAGARAIRCGPPSRAPDACAPGDGAAQQQRRGQRWHLPRLREAEPRLLLRAAAASPGLPQARRLYRRLGAGQGLRLPVLPCRLHGYSQRHRPVVFNPSVPPAPGIAHPHRRTILYLGRLEERKGLGTLLDAYSLLRQVRADCQLVVVSDGPLRRGFERRVEEEGIPDVLFCGFIPEAEKPSYFTAADIYCAPNTGKESFGVILLEAMASGRPVVATAIDGFRQVITDGVEGLLTPPRDEAQMAAALARLLDDAQLRRQLGERGRLVAERLCLAAGSRPSTFRLRVSAQSAGPSRGEFLCSAVCCKHPLERARSAWPRPLAWSR